MEFWILKYAMTNKFDEKKKKNNNIKNDLKQTKRIRTGKTSNLKLFWLSSIHFRTFSAWNNFHLNKFWYNYKFCLDWSCAIVFLIGEWNACWVQIQMDSFLGFLSRIPSATTARTNISPHVCWYVPMPLIKKTLAILPILYPNLRVIKANNCQFLLLFKVQT